MFLKYSHDQENIRLNMVMKLEISLTVSNWYRSSSETKTILETHRGFRYPVFERMLSIFHFLFLEPQRMYHKEQ